MVKVGNVASAGTGTVDFYFVFDKAFEDNDFAGVMPKCDTVSMNLPAPKCSYAEFAPNGCPYCRMVINCPYGEWQCEGKGAVYPLGTMSGSDSGTNGCTTTCRKYCTLNEATGLAEWSDEATTAEVEVQKWNSRNNRSWRDFTTAAP